MTDKSEKLRQRIEAYLSENWGGPVTLVDFRQIPGGAARATWRTTACQGASRSGLIIRAETDADAGLNLSEDRIEFNVMRAAFRSGLPVAEPLVLEEDSRWTGGPFSVVREVPDCITAVADTTEAQKQALGEQKWTILGQIARLATDELDLADTLDPVTADTTAGVELARWRAVYDTTTIHPDPVAAAAYRWLAANPPPAAAKLALVHGDYRTGNFLFDGSGTIRSILDWEMAHFGDPLEDLAWSLDPRQEVDSPERAGGLLPHAQAIAIWERASGLTVDPVAFRWWQVFNAYKALAIWTLSGKTYVTGATKRPVLARIGWMLVERQRRVLMDYLSPHSPQRLFRYEP